MKKLPEPGPASSHVTGQVSNAAIHPDPRQAIYLPEGSFVEFHKLGPRHHLEQESTALRSDPANEYPVDPFALGED